MTGIRVAGACALVAAAFGAGTAPAYGQATAAPEKIHVEARLMSGQTPADAKASPISRIRSPTFSSGAPVSCCRGA